MATDEPDVDDAIGIIDQYDDAVIVTADVEHQLVFRTRFPPVGTGSHIAHGTAVPIPA